MFWIGSPVHFRFRVVFQVEADVNALFDLVLDEVSIDEGGAATMDPIRSKLAAIRVCVVSMCCCQLVVVP